MIGGDSLQLWKVAANTLNKQPQAAKKGWSSSFGVGSEAHRKKIGFLQNFSVSFRLGRILLVNDLSYGIWIYELALGIQ
jgi:hypothetical protein